MLRRNNTTVAGCGAFLSLGTIGSTLASLAPFLVMLAVSFAATEPPAARPPAAPPAEAPRVDANSARLAFDLIEAWCKQTGVPTENLPDPIWVSDVVAARVTLRWNGKHMASGTAVIDALTPHIKVGAAPGAGAGAAAINRVVDLTQLTAGATSAALEELAAEMRNIAIRTAAAAAARQQEEGGQPVPVPVRAQQTLSDLGPLLQVDLQLAHRPQPITLAGNAPPDAVFAQFIPGHHVLSLAASKEEGRSTLTWNWPATALAFNNSPQSQLIQLLSAQSLPFTAIPSIARSPALTLTRYEVIHLVRPWMTPSVVELIRGQEILPPAILAEPALIDMAGRLARHLMNFRNSRGVFQSDYLPTSDVYSGNATPYEHALAAYALSRHASQLAEGKASNPQVEILRSFTSSLLDDLARMLAEPEAISREPAAAALALLTLVESPFLVERKVQRDHLARYLTLMIQRDGSFARVTQPGETPAAPAAVPNTGAATQPTAAAQPAQIPRIHTLMTLALAAYHQQSRDVAAGSAAWLARQWLWRTHTPRDISTGLPWLAPLEMRYAAALPPSPAAVAPPVDEKTTVANILHLLSDELYSLQVQPGPSLPVEDVVGGFDTSRQTTTPQPDWRSAHYLNYLAYALRHQPPDKPDQVIKRLLSCGLGSRFLAQLMFTETSAFYVRGRTEALGGLRRSLIDNTLSPEYSASALLAITELQATLASPVIARALGGK